MNQYQRTAIAKRTGIDPETPKSPSFGPTKYRLTETTEGKILGEGTWALISHIKKHHKALNPSAKYRTEPV